MGPVTPLRSRYRAVTATAGLVLAGSIAIASCTSPTPDGATRSPDPTPSPTCAAGADGHPTQISRLTLDGVSSDTFATTLTVPFEGLRGGSFDQPSVVRAAVVTGESGAPVTFRTDTGGLIASLEDDWLDAPGEVTVRSVKDGGECSASVYLFGTRVGPLTLRVESSDVLSTSVDVVTDSSAARTLAVDLDSTEVMSGEDISVAVTASDVFGNPVSGSAIVVSVPRDAPARYPNGSHRATVLTDDDGRAEVRLLTSAVRTRSFNVRVRGVDPRCADVNQAEVNQYGCTADEPFPGAGDPIFDVRVNVTVVPPTAPEEEGISPRSARRSG
jgi:hypothetical protein